MVSFLKNNQKRLKTVNSQKFHQQGLEYVSRKLVSFRIIWIFSISISHRIQPVRNVFYLSLTPCITRCRKLGCCEVQRQISQNSTENSKIVFCWSLLKIEALFSHWKRFSKDICSVCNSVVHGIYYGWQIPVTTGG